MNRLHGFNRANTRAQIFDNDNDYPHFMKIIAKKIYGKAIITSFDEHIALPEEGQYLFEIRASAKSWWQNTAGRRTLLKKDSLMLTLNSKEIFPLPKKRKLRADDFWNGNVLRGKNQTIYIVSHSLKGDASIGFIVHGKPFLEEVNVYSILDGEVALQNLSPSKRDRTPWLTLLMAEGVTLNLISLSARAAVLGDDDQDIQIILDGKKEPNQKNTTHKDWYWCGYALRDKPLKFERHFEDGNGPSRIDFIADGTPIIQSFIVKVQVAQFDYPTPRLYRPGPRGEDYNKYDSLIAKVVHDSKGIRIWFFAAGLALLMSGAMTAFGLSNGMSGRTTSEEVLKSEILKNQIYVIDGKLIPLHDGFHIFSSNLSESEKEKVNPYDSYDGPYYVRYETGAVGDLNGDGNEDGVAVLGVNYGGTGYYIHLAEVLSQSDGTYKHVGSYVFKDRDVVEDVSVRNGVVEVVSIEHGPDDPSCCPTVHSFKKLTLADFLINQ